MLSDAERDAGFSRFDIKESFAFDAVNDRIIGANMNGDVFALDRRTGEKRRSFKMEFGSYATPVIHDDAVFVTSLDKNLYCLNLALEKRWAWNAGARIFATPVIIDTNLYIGANTGRLTEIDPASGRATSFLQLTERITNRVAYNPSTKRFFVPTFANEIYSVEKTGI
jgi:outer membrane protein assembly factor BamB